MRGDQLHLEQVLPSGGSFPVSLGNHGDLLYVLNAGGTGTVSGFRIEDAGLEPIPGSTRSLGLANAPTPFFLSSPAQVGFTPDGHDLLVTTKTHSQVDVFRVGSGGELSAAPVVNAVPGVPFAFLFVGNELALVNAIRRSLGRDEDALQVFLGGSFIRPEDWPEMALGAIERLPGSGRRYLTSLNRSEQLPPELPTRHTVQHGSTATFPYSRRRPRPVAH